VVTEADGLHKVQQERRKSWRETEQERVYPERKDRPLFVHGLMKYLFDDEEMPYLDFVAGNATLPLGHSFPGTTSSIGDASKTFFSTGGWGEYAHGEQMEYLHWLERHFTEGTRFLFTESENDAIRAAVDMVGGKVRFVNRRNLPFGVRSSLDAESLFVYPIDPDTFEVLPDEKLREVWEEHERGALIIWDASVPSFGWNGDLFRFPDYADYIVLGGALGGGLPLGAVAGTALVSSAKLQGRRGAFAGNSLAFAAGRMTYHGVNKALERGDYVYLAEKIEHELEQLVKQFPNDYLELTGIGLLRGLVCRSVKFATDVRNRCRVNGALLGGSGNVIRVVVPLAYQKEDLEELASILLESTMEVRELDD